AEGRPDVLRRRPGRERMRMYDVRSRPPRGYEDGIRRRPTKYQAVPIDLDPHGFRSGSPSFWRDVSLPRDPALPKRVGPIDLGSPYGPGIGWLRFGGPDCCSSLIRDPFAVGHSSVDGRSFTFDLRNRWRFTRPVVGAQPNC